MSTAQFDYVMSDRSESYRNFESDGDTDVGSPAGPLASVFFFRCTHKVKDDLQLSRFVG